MILKEDLAIRVPAISIVSGPRPKKNRQDSLSSPHGYLLLKFIFPLKAPFEKKVS